MTKETKEITETERSNSKEAKDDFDANFKKGLESSGFKLHQAGEFLAKTVAENPDASPDDEGEVAAAAKKAMEKGKKRAKK